MSDRTRSPEEIEGEISRRQEELAEDLEDLEYRLSRRGIKDRAGERVSSAAHDLANRANSLREQATERARQLGSRAGERLATTGRGAVDRAERNRPIVAMVAGGVAAGLGLFFALKSSGQEAPGRGFGPVGYSSVGPTVPTRSFQYADFGDY